MLLNWNYRIVCLYFYSFCRWVMMSSCHICILDTGKVRGYFHFCMNIFLFHLSHTWVRYPGFSGHGIKCPILTTVVPGFSGDLIGCTIRSKWGPFGDLYLARRNRLCVWNMLFLGEINFPKGELVPWSLYGDKLSLCRNQQMNGKI